MNLGPPDAERVEVLTKAVELRPAWKDADATREVTTNELRRYERSIMSLL